MATRRDDGPVDGADRVPQSRSPEGARQARVVLTTRRRRTVFLAGLIGLVLMAVAGSLFACARDPYAGPGRHGGTGMQQRYVIGLHVEGVTTRVTVAAADALEAAQAVKRGRPEAAILYARPADADDEERHGVAATPSSTEAVDGTIEDSFPASDPPAWTTARAGAPDDDRG